MKLRTSIALSVGALLVAVAADSSAQSTASGTLSGAHPAATCRINGLSVYGPVVNNLSGVTQVLQCPLEMDKQWWNPRFVAVRVNPGWATTSSCNIAFESPDGGVWTANPTSIQHPNGSRDEVTWLNIDGTPGVAAVVQCWVPANAQVRDYYVESNLHIYNFYPD
jgi:hypothetical protein